MSALTERIAAEHHWTPADRCKCGKWAPRQGVGPHDFIQHIAEVTEAAVREQIAAELEALSKTAWNAYKNGFGIERGDPYTEGQSDAYDTAATLAKEGTASTASATPPSLGSIPQAT